MDKRGQIEMDMYFGNLEKSYPKMFQIQYDSHDIVIVMLRINHVSFMARSSPTKINFTLLFSSLELIIK